jgi:hypothetical protein
MAGRSKVLCRTDDREVLAEVGEVPRNRHSVPKADIATSSDFGTARLPKSDSNSNCVWMPGQRFLAAGADASRYDPLTVSMMLLPIFITRPHVRITAALRPAVGACLDGSFRLFGKFGVTPKAKELRSEKLESRSSPAGWNDPAHGQPHGHAPT